MRFSVSLREFVAQLRSRHNILDSEPEIQFQLGENEQLVVTQTPDGRQIRLSRVTGYINVQRNELEILFFVDDEGRWVPYQYVRPATGRQICGVVNPPKKALVLTNPPLQRGMVIQCDLWATRLKHEGWLELSTRVTASGQPSDGLMLWPIPTVEEPDDEQIEAWLMDIELCEATDGCQTDPDGTCPHGYPSWLRYLGLV